MWKAEVKCKMLLTVYGGGSRLGNINNDENDLPVDRMLHKDFMIEAVKMNPSIVGLISGNTKFKGGKYLLEDSDFMLEAVIGSPENIRHVGLALKSNGKFVLDAVFGNGEVVQYATHKQKQIVEEAMIRIGAVLSWAVYYTCLHPKKETKQPACIEKCIVFKHRNAIHIVFRGTADPSDLEADIDIVDENGMHSGFLNEWEKRRSSVEERVINLMRESEYHSLKRAPASLILVCGHSLGGAIAQHCYKWLTDMLEEKKDTSTFVFLRTYNSPPIVAEQSDTCHSPQKVSPMEVLHVRSDCDFVSSLEFKPSYFLKVFGVTMNSCSDTQDSTEIVNLGIMNPVECHSMWSLYSAIAGGDKCITSQYVPPWVNALLTLECKPRF